MCSKLHDKILSYLNSKYPSFTTYEETLWSSPMNVFYFHDDVIIFKYPLSSRTIFVSYEEVWGWLMDCFPYEHQQDIIEILIKWVKDIHNLNYTNSNIVKNLVCSIHPISFDSHAYSIVIEKYNKKYLNEPNF